MSDESIEEKVRKQTRSQLEEALESVHREVSPDERIRAIASAETTEERELAIAAAVAAGDDENLIRNATRMGEIANDEMPQIDLDEDDDDEDEDTIASAPLGDIAVEGSVTLSLLMTVQKAETLEDAMRAFHSALARFGTEAFHILAHDDSGAEHVINGDRVIFFDEENEDGGDDQ